MSKSLIVQAFQFSRRMCSICEQPKMMGAERYSKKLSKLLWVCTDCQIDRRAEFQAI